MGAGKKRGEKKRGKSEGREVKEDVVEERDRKELAQGTARCRVWSLRHLNYLISTSLNFPL